jgi:hypothetical protein
MSLREKYKPVAAVTSGASRCPIDWKSLVIPADAIASMTASTTPSAAMTAADARSRTGVALGNKCDKKDIANETDARLRAASAAISTSPEAVREGVAARVGIDGTPGCSAWQYNGR